VQNETKENLLVQHSTVNALEDSRNTVIRADSVIDPDGNVRHMRLQFLQASQTRGEEPYCTFLPMSELFFKFDSLEGLQELMDRLLDLRPEITGMNGNGRHHSHLIELTGQGIIICLDSALHDTNQNNQPGKLTLRMINKLEPSVNLTVGAYSEVVEEVCETLGQINAQIEAESENVQRSTDLPT
ncbi:uncharacterized protein METZ01_LOCUS385657, partial [marine metagenome]